MNRRGFTLIELLGVIVIISLVIGGSVFGITKLIDKSKNEGSNISVSSIKQSASVYATEKSNDKDYWKRIDNRKGYEGEYFCITIGELQNKGLLDKNIDFSSLPNNISKSTYVGIRKDLVTYVQSNPMLLNELSTCDVKTGGCSEADIIYGACTGNIINEVLDKFPSLEGSESYTDEINEIKYTDAIGDDVVIEEVICEYGKNSSNLDSTGTINTDSHTCDLKELISGTYYIRVCETTQAGSTACSPTEERKTTSVKKPSIKLSENSIGIKIHFNNENITKDKDGKVEAKYYFRSSLSADSGNINVYECNSDKKDCNTSVTKIKENTWYLTSEEDITLTYSNSGNLIVDAETCDKTGNCNDNSSEFSIYKITFKKGNADTIDDKVEDIDKLCIANKNEACSIISPRIKKEGYDIVGWNKNSTATSSEWDISTSKNIQSDGVYYPITKIGSYTLKYDTQGGTSIASQKVNVGSSVTVTSTIPTKAGYKFVSWNTNKDGNGTTYSGGNSITLKSNMTLYAIWTYSVPIISCNNVFPDDSYAWSSTNGSVRISVTDDDGDLDTIYYNKGYFEPITYTSIKSTFYVTDAKTNMIRVYAMDKAGHISSNQMPEWSSPTGTDGVVYCYTNLDIATPNTPLVSLLKNKDGSWDLSEMTNISNIETDCCYKYSGGYPNCNIANIKRNATTEQSCTINVYRNNTSSKATLIYYYLGEDWFGDYIKEYDGDMFEAKKITGISGEDYYYVTDYNASGNSCSRKCTNSSTKYCTSCMSNTVKSEVYLVDKVGHKSKTLTIYINWK